MGDLAKIFGDKVRSLRGDRKLTQVRLAELASVSEEWIRRIERGEASPSFDTVEALALALQARPAEFFEDGGPETPAERFADAVTSLSEDEIAWLVQGARLLRKGRE